MIKPGRSLFQAHNWRPGTPDEYWEAGSGYIAYCGVSEVDEENETVTHLPSVALVPNLILKGQLRSITLSGGRPTLCAVGVPVADGPSVTSRLEWQRASTGNAGVESGADRSGARPERLRLYALGLRA